MVESLVIKNSDVLPSLALDSAKINVSDTAHAARTSNDLPMLLYDLPPVGIGTALLAISALRRSGRDADDLEDMTDQYTRRPSAVTVNN
jgi:hypothetical protein